MTKKVFIGVLTALMLFAFVACDNSSVGQDSMGMMVVSIETESVPAVVQGQKVSLSNYEVVATRYNGDTFIVPESDLKFATDPVAMTEASADEKDAKNVSKIVYVGPYASIYNGTGVATEEPVTAMVYAIKAITVSGPSDARYYQNLASDKKTIDNKDASIVNQFRTSEYTVSAIYEDFDEVEHTVVLSSDDYKTDLTDTSDDTIGAVTVTFTPKTISNFTQDTEYADKNETRIIIEKDKVTGWSVAEKTYEYINGGNAPTSNYAYTATARWESGATSELAQNALTANWTSGVSSGKFLADAQTAVLTLTKDGVSQNVTYNLTAPYISKFEASATGYSPVVGKAIDKTKITISPTWAGGVTGTADFTNGKGFSLDTTVAPNETGSFPVVVTLDGQAKAGSFVLVLSAVADSTPSGD